MCSSTVKPSIVADLTLTIEICQWSLRGEKRRPTLVSRLVSLKMMARKFLLNPYFYNHKRLIICSCPTVKIKADNLCLVGFV